MDEEAYTLAAKAEGEHWWFRGRRVILKSLLDHYLADADVRSDARDILEIGCGNGGNLPLLAAYGHMFAVEGHAQARERASKLGIAEVEEGWLPDGLPYPGRKFDLIAALDVIEHVDDDRSALQAMQGRLRPDGLLLLTVPAYRWLWSHHDVLSQHKRRYTRQQIVALLSDIGCEVLYSGYFNTLLFPLAVAYFKLGHHGQSPAGMKPPPALLNAVLRAMFSAERLLVPRQVLPFGVSVVAVARMAATPI